MGNLPLNTSEAATIIVVVVVNNIPAFASCIGASALVLIFSIVLGITCIFKRTCKTSKVPVTSNQHPNQSSPSHTPEYEDVELVNMDTIEVSHNIAYAGLQNFA